MTEDALNNKYGWLVSSTWQSLHYVPGVNWNTWDHWWDDWTEAPKLKAACGRTIKADLPGLFSRMGCPRCAKCCDALRISRGNGAPVNDETARAL